MVVHLSGKPISYYKIWTQHVFFRKQNSPLPQPIHNIECALPYIMLYHPLLILPVAHKASFPHSACVNFRLTLL